MNPKYLNIGLLSDEQQTRMFAYLKQQTTDVEILAKLNQWEVYAKKMPITSEEIIKGRLELKKFFADMGNVQGNSWATIFPKCYEMIQEW